MRAFSRGVIEYLVLCGIGVVAGVFLVAGFSFWALLPLGLLLIPVCTAWIGTLEARERYARATEGESEPGPSSDDADRLQGS